MELIQGDCLVAMQGIPDKSIDMILCDLPYGTTACKWDIVILFEPLWEQYKRIIKQNGVVVLFGSEPFSSLLRVSNIPMYKYDWYWKKSRPGGFVNAKLKPLKDVETISVFSTGTTANGARGNMPYYPQGLEDIQQNWKRPDRYFTDAGVNPTRKSHKLERVIEKKGYPRQILEYPNPNNCNSHPTQKPVDLCEYLIETYTKENETVLDNCMGSGTTGIACLNTNRRFVGIEKDQTYFNTAKDRIENHLI